MGVPLTQNQFDALVSFVYNAGAGNFESSPLLKMLNGTSLSPRQYTGDYLGAATRLHKYEGLRGLGDRRNEEERLFLER